jgi:hypothetical protein
MPPAATHGYLTQFNLEGKFGEDTSDRNQGLGTFNMAIEPMKDNSRLRKQGILELKIAWSHTHSPAIPLLF